MGRFCCDLLQGPDSFKADVYGKSILIQRTLYKQGGCVSKFSVRNGTNGKEVETKLAVVHDICDAFNIQIENPCAILMQETAKQFLTSASGAVKYRFFTDATRIAAAEKDYVTATDEITAVQATLVRLRDMLKDMRDKRDALEREAQAAQHLMELGSRIRAYENELLVSHLNDKIAELAELAEKVAAFESNRARLVRERDEADRAFEVARANREQSGASVESLKNETAVIAEEVKQITAQIQLERVALFEAETNASRVRQEMQSNERSLDRKRQARATLQREARAETMSRGERERVRVAEQDRLDDAAKAARERVEQRENDLKSHQERIRSMGADQQETRQRAEALKAAVTGAERELHKARASRTDALALFGDGASDVHKELKRVLGDRCIGPVGAVLKVRNPQWAFAIEACLIQDMFAYCVPDYDTLKEANDIVKRVNPRTRPSIIVQRASTLHNVSPEMRQKPNSILNQINNDVPALIINTLIDMHDVDRVLLFETEAQGNRDLFGASNANFRVGYVKNGTKLSLSSAGVQSTVAWEGPRAAKHIGVDAAHNIEASERALSAASSEYEMAASALKKSDQAFQAARSAEATARTQLERAEADAKRASAAADAFRSSVVNVENSKAEELSALDAEIAEREETLRRLEVSVRECDDIVATGRQPLDVLETKLNAAQERGAALRNRFAEAQNEMVPLNAAVADAERKKQRSINGIVALDRDVEPMARQREEGEQRLAELEQRVAAQVGDVRPVVTLTTVQIEAKLVALTKSRDRERGQHRDPAVIKAELDAAAEKYNETSKAVHDMTEWQEHMSSGIGRRLMNLSCMKQQVGRRVGDQFNTMLSQQGHSGNVLFDHTDRTLEASVKLANQEALSARSTATLSGGERMFSTVSLLLALWNCMDMPFRALDEFDVFMDAQNRGTSINLLVRAARQDKLRQYIFISPHEVSSIPNAPDIHIVKMHNPDRNQRLLNFAQAQQ